LSQIIPVNGSEPSRLPTIQTVGVSLLAIPDCQATIDVECEGLIASRLTPAGFVYTQEFYENPHEK
jgi:hypothetical protein